MPAEGERHRGAVVTEVGRVQDAHGLPLTVGVNGGLVTIAGHPLNCAQRESFAAMFVRACWLAGDGEP
jgi:hypothetical protein